ncbi:hypothetical protein STAS_19819 [Striga asiatica]|uniref:Uncharacterized protein n=1 Tax=Striga asiatica TaxID=4170 RepID=A0A5A7QF00_STRAF|nr:hypothetical protein STAS_19819 [Striga asiatica]
MYGFTRTKSVTDPLDDKAKARLIQYEPCHVSSGSEHSAQADPDITSPILSELFYGFTEPKNDSGTDLDPPPMRDSSFVNADLTDAFVVDLTDEDEFRIALEADVLRARQVFSGEISSDKQMERRSVMAFLRNRGYEAAVCKTKWEKSGELAAGSYEIIDVVAAAGTRYLVDLDFASEFEIARPTEAYERLRRGLPEVFVGRGEYLRRILKAMSGAARRSLKSGGLHLPPWRKYQYMRLKWLGPYRRTTNLLPASFCAGYRSFDAVCCSRTVGFDTAANGGGRAVVARAK